MEILKEITLLKTYSLISFLGRFCNVLVRGDFHEERRTFSLVLRNFSRKIITQIHLKKMCLEISGTMVSCNGILKLPAGLQKESPLLVLV
jgi:hypothetical protein